MPHFVCCECGKKKESKDELKSHLSIKHVNYLPFKCAHCPTWEATQTHMIVHINETHPGNETSCTCNPDPQKHKLLKDKIRLSKNAAAISTQPQTVTEEIKTEVITIDDEESKTPSSSVVTDSTDQTLSVGETNGSKENHPAVNSVLSQGCGNPGIGGVVGKQLNPSASSVNALIEEQEMKPRIEDDESSGDDFEPETPPPPTTGASQSQQPDVGHQSPLNSRITNSTQEHRKIKPELIVDDDPDDDFVPDPPISNNGDSQSQQPDVGHSSSADARDAIDSEDDVGSSSQQHSIDGIKRSKSKKKVKGKAGRKTLDNKGKTKKLRSKHLAHGGYCMTCERSFLNPYQHLEYKLSSPVFTCSNCTFRAKSTAQKWKHANITPGCRGAKMVRVRSKSDVAQEMLELRQTHFGVGPGKPYTYRCTECKKSINSVDSHILKHHLKVKTCECPVCGWSSHRSAVKAHMQQKHGSDNSQAIICGKTKYREEIREIQKAVIVRNK